MRASRQVAATRQGSPWWWRYHPRVRPAVALTSLAAVWLHASVSNAAPTSRLVYSRSTDAASCPDEQALRRAVAARIGYDPFFAWATRTIVAGVTRRDGVYLATVELVDEAGTSHGARELRAEGECTELLDAVALAIAIAIDPQSLTRQPAAAPPPVPGPAAPEERRDTVPSMGAPATVDAPEPAHPAVPPVAPLHVELAAGAVASGGVAPAPAVGLALSGGLRWPWFSLSLEGRIDAPASTNAQGGGEVTSWLVLAGLAPCLHLGPVFACALAQGGSMQSWSSGVPNTQSASAPWWAVGGRVGALVPMVGATLLRVRTDVLADLDPATLTLNGAAAWRAPALAVSLGADVVVRFP